MSNGCSTWFQRRVERTEPCRCEGPQVGATRGALSDQLGQGLAGRRSVEDAPNAVAGSHIYALNLRHFADQRQAVRGLWAEAGLPR
jgi:hypothetical protein